MMKDYFPVVCVGSNFSCVTKQVFAFSTDDDFDHCQSSREGSSGNELETTTYPLYFEISHYHPYSYDNIAFGSTSPSVGILISLRSRINEL